MAFTYDINTSIGQVRFYSGDNNADDYLLEDDEISFLLTQNNNNIKQASANAVEGMIAELAREPDSKKVGNLSLGYAKRMEQLQTLLTNLRADANRRLTPYAGGISKTQKDIFKQDTDIVQPKFSKDLMTYDKQVEGDDDDAYG